MKTYISLTLGPISRVISTAKKTKEVWAASYFFSYLAKHVIKPFALGGCSEERKRDFIFPLVDDSRLEESYSGAGLFPDRYIFQSEKGDFEYLKRYVDIVLQRLSSQMSISLSSSSDEIYTFLKSYLKIYFFEKEFDDTVPVEEIISTCEDSMNLIEMQDRFPEKEEKNYLHLFFKNVNGKPEWNGGFITGFKGTFLSKDAFGKEKRERLFESLLEISALDKGSEYLRRIATNEYKLDNFDDKDKNGESLEGLQKEQDELMKGLLPYQKYIAIVKVDGDSIGEAKRKINEKKENHIDATKATAGNASKKISEAFLEFNINAVRIINDYGGKPVFVGGDDLLFFAPVFVSPKKQTIFDLINGIDTCFNDIFSKEIDQPPTLSYGVSITYYKYPMSEALAKADYLLFKKAKNGDLVDSLYAKGIKAGRIKFIRKNNIALSMQKHSGQMVEMFLHKGNIQAYEKAWKCIQKYAGKKGDADKNEDFLASVMHKLKSYEPMFQYIFNGEKQREALLKSFFDNNFNEAGHERYSGIFECIQQMLLTSFDEINDQAKEFNENIESFTELLDNEREKLLMNPVSSSIDFVYTTLRFIHFINSESNG